MFVKQVYLPNTRNMVVNSPATIRPSAGFNLTRYAQTISNLPLVGGDNLQPYVTVIPEVTRHGKVLGGNDKLVCIWRAHSDQ